MSKQIFILDKVSNHTVIDQDVHSDIKISVHECSLAFQIECAKNLDNNVVVFINPYISCQNGKPSVTNLIHFIRAAKAAYRIYFIFETEKQMQFYRKNIVSNVDGHLTKPLNVNWQDFFSSNHLFEKQFEAHG